MVHVLSKFCNQHFLKTAGKSDKSNVLPRTKVGKIPKTINSKQSSIPPSDPKLISYACVVKQYPKEDKISLQINV